MKHFPGGIASDHRRGFGDRARARPRAGSRLAISDVNEEGLEETRHLAEKRGAPQVLAERLDVADREAVEAHTAIYYTRFRLNHRMVADYRHLSRWLQRFYRLPGVAEASNLEHARRGSFGRTGNNIVPLGPEPMTFSAIALEK